MGTEVLLLKKLRLGLLSPFKHFVMLLEHC